MHACSAILIRTATAPTIVSPEAGRNAFLGPDYATTDMRLTRRLYVHDRVKLDLVAESFNLLNRDNQRVQFSDDGFLNTAGQFVQVDNQTGINHFPAQYPAATELPASHRRLCSASSAD